MTTALFTDNFIADCEARLMELREKAKDVKLEDSSSGLIYPALQLDNYQPKGKDNSSWCFGEESKNLLPESVVQKLKLQQTECWFNDKQESPVICHKITAKNLRFVPLCLPQKGYVLDKETQLISINGGDWKPNYRSVAKLFLALIVEGELLLGDDGLPVVVTLKLKSFNVSLVVGSDDKSQGTLRALNAQIAKLKIGKGVSLLHFVNISIDPVSKVFESKDKKLSSKGVSYSLGNASLNSGEQIDDINVLLKDEVFLSQIDDPFGVKKTSAIVTEPYSVDEETGEVLTDILF